MTEKNTRKVELFDTSLRDGLQQPDLEISVPNAVLLLERMAAFGVRYAEIGFAGANQFVADLTGALESVDTGAMTLALFGRTRGRGAKVEDWPDVQFIVRHKRRVPVAVIVVKSRLLDVERSLETTPEENLLMAWETIEYLHANGLEVFVDLEHAMDANCGRCENGNPCDADFSKRSLDHFRQLTEQCVRQKVSRIVVCDTNGGASPEEVAQVFDGLASEFPGAKFGFHGHTDRGLGVANTRAAILAGAVQVQGTLIGTGERCGNVNLTTVVGAMQLRGEAEFVPPESLNGLTGLAHSAYAAFGLEAAARRAHRRSRRIRHLGRHARLQRAQESRRVSLVRSRARGRQPHHRRQRAVGQGQHHAALRVARRAAQLRAGAGADGRQPGHDRGRRLHGQRSFVPPGLHENAGNPAQLVHRQELARLRRVRRGRRPLRAGLHDADRRRLDRRHHPRRRRRPRGRADQGDAPRAR